MHNVLQQLYNFGVTPVVTIADAGKAAPVAKALAAGGLGVIEIAFRSEAALQSLAKISRECPDVLAGAGTVLDAGQAAQALDAGARFIVSPGFDEKTAEFCLMRKVLYLPGCYTATEIQKAASFGVRTVKFFPAESGGGVAMLKALSAAFAGARFVPTGGLTPDNFNLYLRNSFVVCVGSSWVAPGALIAAADYAAITARAETTVATVLDLKISGIAGANGLLAKFFASSLILPKTDQELITATTPSLARAEFYLQKSGAQFVRVEAGLRVDKFVGSTALLIQERN